MGEPFFFFERRSVLFIWCDKIIKNVVFKSFCWLQLSIEGISFVSGPSTLLMWNWRVCVCLGVYFTCCGFIQYCTCLRVKLLQPITWLGTILENNICTVFPLWSKQADALLVTAQYKATRFFDSVHFLQLESLLKQESWQTKSLGSVCVCSHACMQVSDRVGVWLF